MERCRELACVHQERASCGGLRSLKAEQTRERNVLQEIEAERSQRTLGSLLDTYIAYLIAQGRRSHTDARQIFDRHVVEPWPKVSQAPAADLTPDQMLNMLRCLIEAGKGRTANKLRSYLRAAYQCALDVKMVAAIPIAFKVSAVQVNPVAHTRRSPQFDRANKRPFTVAQLRAYWALIAGVPGERAAVLRLHLLSGGQRIEQLLRLRQSDIAADAIQLHDLKGRRGQGARPYSVPLVSLARDALGEIAPERKAAGIFAISTTGGARPISVRTLHTWAHDIFGVRLTDFQLKRVRSVVETLLAASGVPREVRGHLQSHGLTGVQARRYDGHDYISEKRRALDIVVEVVCKARSATPRHQTRLRRRFGLFGKGPRTPDAGARSEELTR